MTTLFFKLIALSFCVGIVFLAVPLKSQPPSPISQANQLYNQNQFEEAARIYENEIMKGKINGHLHYNLGNAYFRMGALAGAVHHYFKAQNLLPRDEDVEANLAYALRQTEGQLDERKPHALESILFWIPDLNLKEHGVALLWINLALWISMTLRLHYDTPATRSARNILLALLVVASVSTVFRWHLDSRPSPKVIIPKQNIEQWAEIEWPDGRKSWVSMSKIQR